MNKKIVQNNFEEASTEEKGDWIVMKDVVLNEVKKELSKEYNRRENFIKVLTKICLDFKIYNCKEVISDFLKQQ